MQGLTDIVSAHARVASAEALVRDRRALYRAAGQEFGLGRLSNGVVDNPVLRAAIGQALGGGRVPVEADGASLSEFGPLLPSGDACITLAATEVAAYCLAPALATIQRGLPDASEMRLVLAEDDDFAEVQSLVGKGLRYALEADPELTRDLIPHIQLVAVARDGASRRLGSASAREFPGLLVIPLPSSAAEVAEALIHEGAHQKLFDLSVTHEVLGGAARAVAPYRPSWSQVGTQWPMEQVVAAWHAYACLARFSVRSGDTGPGVEHGSLLTDAADRAAELLDEVQRNSAVLGRDAVVIIEGISGQQVPSHGRSRRRRSAVDRGMPGVRLESIEGSERKLALLPGSPPTLFWVAPTTQTTVG